MQQMETNKRITVDEFVELYANSVKEYLKTQFKNDKEIHIEDLAVNAASFSEAFYITIGNLY